MPVRDERKPESPSFCRQTRSWMRSPIHSRLFGQVDPTGTKPINFNDKSTDGNHHLPFKPALSSFVQLLQVTAGQTDATRHMPCELQMPGAWSRRAGELRRHAQRSGRNVQRAHVPSPILIVAVARITPTARPPGTRARLIPVVRGPRRRLHPAPAWGRRLRGPRRCRLRGCRRGKG